MKAFINVLTGVSFIACVQAVQASKPTPDEDQNTPGRGRVFSAPSKPVNLMKKFQAVKEKEDAKEKYPKVLKADVIQKLLSAGYDTRLVSRKAVEIIPNVWMSVKQSAATYDNVKAAVHSDRIKEILMGKEYFNHDLCIGDFKVHADVIAEYYDDIIPVYSGPTVQTRVKAGDQDVSGELLSYALMVNGVHITYPGPNNNGEKIKAFLTLSVTTSEKPVQKELEKGPKTPSIPSISTSDPQPRAVYTPSSQVGTQEKKAPARPKAAPPTTSAPVSDTYIRSSSPAQPTTNPLPKKVGKIQVIQKNAGQKIKALLDLSSTTSEKPGKKDLEKGPKTSPISSISTSDPQPRAVFTPSSQVKMQEKKDPTSPKAVPEKNKE